ncbi:MAG TPA: hypothetical protein VEQ63_01170, partial [Bryobacteraceae bacterium]|nr:hypothetical protein [Bryobacteraceae bacterium]
MNTLRLAATSLLCCTLFAAESTARVEYKVLATSKTSTMEKELNEAAAGGYVFASVMGGETAMGGKETVIVMSRASNPGQRVYKLLAANKTSTLEKEMQS